MTVCWKKETDVTQWLVTSPVGSWGAGSVSCSPSFSLFLSELLHSCPLLSFNIWSLFSVMSTRGPAMTPLLKMHRIGTFRGGKHMRWGVFLPFRLCSRSIVIDTISHDWSRTGPTNQVLSALASRCWIVFYWKNLCLCIRCFDNRYRVRCVSSSVNESR